VNIPDYTTQEILKLLPFLTEDERIELDSLLQLDTLLWVPQEGPQLMAYESDADVVGYGGAAGGGKTDLAIGKALNKHRKVAIFRKEGKELTAIVDRFEEILRTRDGYNGQDGIWRLPKHKLQIEFGSLANPGDERKYQGRPKDLLVLDEAANMREQQVRFLMGWVRSVNPNQRCQTLMTFNPPTTIEGRWIIDYFAPWLDKKYPFPAAPGEIRYFAVIDGKDCEVEDGQRFEYNGEIIIPQSRTFIPAKVGDNLFLRDTGYIAVLQALPEPLRSQMLYGDFTAGMKDDVWQVIPTQWVEEAMQRWVKKDIKPTMDSLGVDIARGGDDQTVIARRHGNWFDVPLSYPGKETPDGPITASLVIAATRDRAPIHIDVIGVGSSPYDFLKKAQQYVIGVNVAEKPTATAIGGRLTFMNLRTQLWWQMREALDPANNRGIALPPNKQLLAELCTPKWSLQGYSIKVQSREEIYDEIKRSPDMATAYILALIDTPRVHEVDRGTRGSGNVDYDVYKILDQRD
jgi:hypothetical protein